LTCGDDFYQVGGDDRFLCLGVCAHRRRANQDQDPEKMFHGYSGLNLKMPQIAQEPQPGVDQWALAITIGHGKPFSVNFGYSF
jgi:hypothetical protein